MARVGHILFAGAAATSMIAFVWTIGLWAGVIDRRPYAVYDPGSHLFTDDDEIRFIADPWNHDRRTWHLAYWKLSLLALVLPVMWVRAAWRAGRRPAGFCVRCRYDLRATPERCPECGEAVARE